MRNAVGGASNLGSSHNVREIEGLRAIAVLAVLVFHAFPALLPGGFCGVDIFFVISGYVVGGRLIQAAKTGDLALGHFYAARARRLLPALVTTLTATFLVGWLFLTGPELAALGKHMIAAAGFSNNFVLASEAGYFDAPSATKPLLHLWSLAIEEQFYVVAPLLIWFAGAGGKASSRWVLRLGALSLLWFLWRQEVAPSLTFYDPTCRFWEIAMGVALAQWKSLPTKNSLPLETRVWGSVLLLAILLALLSDGKEYGLIQDPLRTTGLLLMAVCSVGLMGWRELPRPRLLDVSRLLSICGALLLALSLGLSKTLNWPGVQTFIPVLATVIVLCSIGTRGAIPTLLRGRFMVFVGSISYPLYLWHWPALVFGRLLHPNWGIPHAVGTLALTVILAWVTKELIENPIRFGKVLGLAVPRLPWQVPAYAAAVLAIVGLAAVVTGGLPSRFSPNVRSLASWNEPRAYEAWRLGTCYYYLNNPADFAPECSPPLRGDMPTVLLWGDSHAAQLYPGLKAVNQEHRFQLAQWTMGSCPPTAHRIAAELALCETRRQMNWERLRSYHADVIVLGGAWGLYFQAETSAAAADELRRTITEIKQIGVKHVLLFGPGPLWKASVSSELFRSMVRSHSDVIPRRYRGGREDLAELDRALHDAAVSAGAEYFSTLDALCNGEGCMVLGKAASEPPDILFFDKDHLSRSGSNLVVGLSMPLLQTLILRSWEKTHRGLQ